MPPGHCPGLIVVGPHPDDLHRFDVIQNLINQAMLDIDPAGASAGEVADELFIRRRGLIWVPRKDSEELFRLGLKAGTGDLPGVPSCLSGENQSPAHQSRTLEHFSTGVFSPLMMDSRIPGMAVR